MTIKTIQKWGHSLAVRLPQKTAKKLGLKEGSRVLVREREKEIVIQKDTRTLKKIKRDNWREFVLPTRKRKEAISTHIDDILYGASR